MPWMSAGQFQDTQSGDVPSLFQLLLGQLARRMDTSSAMIQVHMCQGWGPLQRRHFATHRDTQDSLMMFDVCQDSLADDSASYITQKIPMSHFSQWFSGSL